MALSFYPEMSGALAGEPVHVLGLAVSPGDKHVPISPIPDGLHAWHGIRKRHAPNVRVQCGNRVDFFGRGGG
jgi:hypothetical protein